MTNPILTEIFPSVTSPGNNGTDASANPPTLTGLTVLSTFTVTVPGQYRVWNNSANNIYVVYGTTGNQTIQAIGPAASANSQGGDTSPEVSWYIGLITVYGVAGSNVPVRHN